MKKLLGLVLALAMLLGCTAALVLLNRPFDKNYPQISKQLNT